MYYDIDKKQFVADSKKSFDGWEFLGMELDMEEEIASEQIYKIHIRDSDIGVELKELRIVYTKEKFLPRVNYKGICF